MPGKLLNEPHLVSILKRRVHRLSCAYSCQSATLLEISCRSSYLKKLKRWQAIVEVQCYGSNERMLLSPEIKLIKMEKGYCKRGKFNKNKNKSLFNS